MCTNRYIAIVLRDVKKRAGLQVGQKVTWKLQYKLFIISKSFDQTGPVHETQNKDEPD